MDTIAIRASPAFTIKPRKSVSLSSVSLSRNQFSYTTTTNNSNNNNSRNSQKLVKVESRGSSRDDVAFDESAYEAERLRLDAKARNSMAETSEREIADHDDPRAWKWAIRKRVWDLMEAQNIAQFPRPVHHRIPNFVGSPAAANTLSGLEVFRVANCVKSRVLGQLTRMTNPLPNPVKGMPSTSALGNSQEITFSRLGPKNRTVSSCVGSTPTNHSGQPSVLQP